MSDFVDFLADEQAKISGDLVVARARGVKFASDVADDFFEAGFDVHVDVFEFLFEGELAAFDLVFDLFEAVDDGLGVIFGDDIGFGKHACVRDGSGYVLFV